MVHKYYNLVFYGEILDGYSGRDVRQSLIELAYLDPQTQEHVLAGSPVIIREHLDYMAATIMQSTCEMQGARCQIELAQIATPAGNIDPAYLYQIEFRGEVAVGRRRAEVQAALQQRFRLSPQALEQLFSGQPRIIKANVDYQAAVQYLTALEDAGAVCQIKPSRTPLPPDRIQAEHIFRPANLDLLICPNCGKRQPISPACTQCGIAIQRFVKKRRSGQAAAGSEHKPPVLISRPGEDEPEDLKPEPPNLPEPGRKPETPRWIYWLLGNVILAFGLSVSGFSIEEFLVPFSLIPGAYDVTAEYKNLFALLYSNLQLIGLTGIVVPIIMFFRDLFGSHQNSAMRHAYLLILFVLLGAALLIDTIVSVFGQRFVTMFTLKGLGLSALGYAIGLGCWLLVHRGEQPPPSETKELLIEEEAGEEPSVDEPADESGESQKPCKRRMTI